MSTAWYKPNRLPKRIRSWTSATIESGTNVARGTYTPRNPRQRRSIEVWETTCVVTNMNTNRNEWKDKHKDSCGREPSDEPPGDLASSSRSALPHFSVLVNPGNPSLSGVSRFSYFPIGGPEPPEHFQISKDSHPIMGYVTSWGGMEVGKGMAFAANTVDGIVHRYGGTDLKRECERAVSQLSPPLAWWERLLLRAGMGSDKNACKDRRGRLREGVAVATRVAGPELRAASGYQRLVHTVPPFFDNENRAGTTRRKELDATTTRDRENSETLLAECYRNSLEIASSSSSAEASATTTPSLQDHENVYIACPLLGAGCRGFPTERAIEVAARTTADWMTTTGTYEQNEMSSSLQEQKQSVTLAFGIPDAEIRKQLIEAIDREVEQRTTPP